MVRYAYPVRLSNCLLHAVLSQRTDGARWHQCHFQSTVGVSALRAAPKRQPNMRDVQSPSQKSAVRGDVASSRSQPHRACLRSHCRRIFGHSLHKSKVAPNSVPMVNDSDEAAKLPTSRFMSIPAASQSAFRRAPIWSTSNERTGEGLPPSGPWERLCVNLYENVFAGDPRFVLW